MEEGNEIVKEQGQKNNEAEIYLLVGFFGAGKTSLIRRVLTDPHGERFAVIQNEFAQGQMGIEQPLIMDQSGTPFSNFLELPNGCICCSAKTDLTAAIEYIIANTPVRKILVQTNGIADPVQSIKQFWFDQQALIHAQLHSVVTVVSAKRWKQDSSKPLFERQIASANRVIVSFVDQTGQQQYKQVVQGVRKLNFECTIERNDVKDIADMFRGNSLFSREGLNNITEEKVEHHGNQIRPVFVKGKCTLKSQLEIEQTLGELLWENQIKVMRIKGAVCLENHPTVFELQGVEDLFEVKPTQTSTDVYKGQTRILVIGEDLNSQVLHQKLKVDQI